MRKILSAMLLLFQIAAFSQDLNITNYVGPTTFSRYEEFAPDITIKNSGIVPINGVAFYFSAYLSTDNQWQASDTEVASIYMTALGAGMSHTGRPSHARIDATPGTYYLILKADQTNQVTETDETNNLLTIPNVVVTSPNVDFTFSSFSLDKSSYTQNSLVKPSYVLTNLGTTNTGSSLQIRFVLSTDAIFSQSDIFLHAEGVSLSGPDNVPSNQNLNMVLPTVANGSYYILAWIDYPSDPPERFQETNETNNVAAIPIDIQSSNADLEITSVLVMHYSGLSSVVKIRNNGTTGVAGYNLGAKVFKDGETPVNYYTPSIHYDQFSGYLGPHEEKEFTLLFPISITTPGIYHVEVMVNFDGIVMESIIWNNTHFSSFTITPPPAPALSFNNLTAGIVDDTDQQINLTLDLTNSGDASSFNENYTVLVKNAQNATVHSEQANVWIDFSPGQTVSKPVTLSLSSPLAVGTYQISVSCTSGCYTNPSSKSINLTVGHTQYTLTGIVKGDDGQAITNGKLFLYQDDGSGVVRFIQKVVPYTGPSFTFPIDGNRHTLYFIPDPIQYPNHVPTIYGTTITLQESNFFTPTANMDVTFEVLSVNSPGTGPGIINGRISADNNSSGRLTQPLTVEAVANVPVILISDTGQIVGIAYTDESGFYEFKDLPRGPYQVMPCFELDDPALMDPFAVDITDKNMSVDLLMKEDGIYPVAVQLFLPQAINFNAFSIYQYGDPSIVPDAQSDVGLPIEYTSSNNSIATVENGEIVINGVGTTVITAMQAGNTFYLPASTTRSLTVIKADQSIILSSLPAKTYGDVPFSIESNSSADLVVTLSSSDPSVASINGNTVTIHGAGTVKITAEQPGNDFYNAAPPLQQLLTVNKATQTIFFDDLLEQNVDAGSFVLSANTNSGLDVTFESSDTEIVSIVGNVATVHKDGVVSITANQLGNQNYLAADHVVRSQVINIVLGVELADLSKHIFPNPTTDFVFFQIPEVENIEVSDVMGRIRKDVVWIDDKIDFSQMEPGVYFVKLVFQNHTEITRVVKN